MSETLNLCPPHQAFVCSEERRDDSCVLCAKNKLIEEQQAEIERCYGLLYGARCAYCGEVVGKEAQNQDISDDLLKAHIQTCPEHPLVQANRRLSTLRTALEEISAKFSESLIPLARYVRSYYKDELRAAALIAQDALKEVSEC